MVNVIDQLQAYEIPHTSYIQAVNHMNERYGELTPAATYDMIVNLSGVYSTWESLNQATGQNFSHETPKEEVEALHSFTLLYLVQESIRASFDTDAVEGDRMYPIAVAKAYRFITENPWVFATPEEDEEVLDPVTGKAKMKKGKKQELAMELYKEYLDEGRDKIIQVFQDELDMSKAGARTYYYNMRNKYGDEK